MFHIAKIRKILFVQREILLPRQLLVFCEFFHVVNLVVGKLAVSLLQQGLRFEQFRHAYHSCIIIIGAEIQILGGGFGCLLR